MTEKAAFQRRGPLGCPRKKPEHLLGMERGETPRQRSGARCSSHLQAPHSAPAYLLSPISYLLSSIFYLLSSIFYPRTSAAIGALLLDCLSFLLFGFEAFLDFGFEVGVEGGVAFDEILGGVAALGELGSVVGEP